MQFIDKYIKWLGQKASLFNILLIGVIVLDVLLRYLFSNTKNWVLELEWHIYAIIFLLGISYALQKDEHVRVDLFYQKYTKKQKAWLNIIGHIVFLIPWCYVVLHTAFTYALNSFSFSEGSPNPGGLPMRYVIKFFIFLGFLMFLIQGISNIFKNIKEIRS